MAADTGSISTTHSNGTSHSTEAVAVVFVLSWPIAILLSSCVSVLFVGSLYIWRLFGYDTSDRTHPRTVKQRFISVAIVCLVSPLIIASFAHIISISSAVHSNSNSSTGGRHNILTRNAFEVLSYIEFWKAIGVNCMHLYLSFMSGVSALLLMLFLWIGPMFEDPWHFHNLAHYATASKLLIVRGLVVGPICEEWVYRGCILSLLYYGQVSFWAAVIVSPFLFGLSHAHHVYYTLMHSLAPTDPHRYRRALFGVLFQLAYTTLFGTLSAIVFLRTGNVLSVIVMHMWCNFCGLPAFSWIKFQNKTADLRNCAAYVIGLTLFVSCLWPLTDPRFFNSPFVY